MWYAKLKSELEKIGFKASEADAGLFILQQDSNKVYLLVYVDDMLIASKELIEVEHVKKTIGTIFNVRDLGEVSSSWEWRFQEITSRARSSFRRAS